MVRSGRSRWSIGVLAALALVAVGCAAGPDPVVVTRSQGAVTTTIVPAGPESTTSSVPGSGPGSPPGTVDGRGCTPVDPTVGDGVGDSLFPDIGNPGIDVLHYDVELTVDPVSRDIAGTVGIDLMATQDRPSFTLDALALDVTAVTVDGRSAPFAEDDPELRITPADGLRCGHQVRVEVSYSATPTPVQSGGGLTSGWFTTPGGSYVLNEPDGARTWLPSNDHPSDKATFTFDITVGPGVTAVANGALVSHDSTATAERWVWKEQQPMTTYLVQLLTGDYELVDGVGPNGLPLLSAVLREDRAAMQPYIDGIADQIDFFDDFFGPYPLDAYGIAITDSFGGLAMETQGRSLFSRADLPGTLGRTQQLLLSHELTHQWFGDAVSPARWRDIWLNESFATYGEWMWLEHVGFGTIEQLARNALRSRGAGSSADPTVDSMFGFNSYDGGAVVLHALRLTIGDTKFFEVLRRWVAEHDGESCTTEQFVAFAEQVSSVDLTAFFDEWLFARRPPDAFPTAPV